MWTPVSSNQTVLCSSIVYNSISPFFGWSVCWSPSVMELFLRYFSRVFTFLNVRGDGMHDELKITIEFSTRARSSHEIYKMDMEHHRVVTYGYTLLQRPNERYSYRTYCGKVVANLILSNVLFKNFLNFFIF